MRDPAVVLLAAIVLTGLDPERADAQQAPIAPTSAILGYVVDQSTQNPISGATVEFPELGKEVITNSNGAFAMLDLPRGRVAMRVRHLGFADYEEELDLTRESVTLTIALGARPIILEGITAKAYSFADQLRKRRRRTAVSVRAIERDRLSMTSAFDALDALFQAGLVHRAACLEPIAFDICVRARGRPVRPSVYIDERPAVAGLLELETYSPQELYSIEVYQGGRHIRAYTTWWVETQARRAEASLMPVIDW